MGNNMKFHLCFYIFGIFFINKTFGIFEFTKKPFNISPDDVKKLSVINSKLELAVQMGMQSLNHEENFEKRLVDSNIVVQNGSISHAHFLESYPNADAINDDRIAKEILKSSQYLSNSYCKRLNVNSESCAQYLSQISLPTSTLRDKCLKIVESRTEGHNAYRRLLQPNYSDGIYEIPKYQKVPKPKEITKALHSNHNIIKSGNTETDETKNLILVQWSQFIEHDLSKLAVTTMADGSPIECCDEDYVELTPRYVHPSCAEIEGVANYSYGRESCLNYVRSSLAVNEKCKFGPAQQLNQASSSLDLSQLYGYTEESRKLMRTFVDGQLKTSTGDLLPLAKDKEKFCVTTDSNSDEPCFMAGDSRVNSNPFVTVLYTIFLRSHNLIAKQLKKHNTTWNDEELYTIAKNLNIDTYRCIIYNEWLPIVLGEDITKIINTEPIIFNQNEQFETGTTNEFAIAAIHFYYSMIPNELNETQNIVLNENVFNENVFNENIIGVSLSENLTNELFFLPNEYYKSNFLSNPNKLTTALEAMLNQRALKMDSHYAESLTKNYLRTASSLNKISGADALAWDIQRGRDHGLAGYVKYLEACTNAKINNWSDLEKYINRRDIENLKSIYTSVNDIDLIVGGVSEKPSLGSTFGPTFTCIIGEQFSNIRKTQFLKDISRLADNDNNGTFNPETIKCNGSKLLCETINLNAVPENIFLAPSEINPLIPCSSLT